MGDVYASLFGTIVIRHRSVPARPAELDGEVVILVEKGGGLDGAGAEAELRSELSGRLRTRGTRRAGGVCASMTIGFTI